MARHHHKKHPGMYRVRAHRHEEAAKHSTGYKREGHEGIAAGYHKLAAHHEYRGGGHRGRKGHHKHKRGFAAMGRYS